MTERIGAGEIYIALFCYCFQLLFISAPHTPVTIKNIKCRQVHSNKPMSGAGLACVAWRFCRAGRRSGVAAKFVREARENERRSREKNKVFQVASAPISSRFLCPRPPLLLSAPNQNRHATQASAGSPSCRPV